MKKKPGSDRAAGLPIYDSMSAAAAATGIPFTVLKHAKRSGCPAFKWNRVALQPFLQWSFTEGLELPEGGIDWRAEFQKYQAKRERTKYEREQKDVADKPTTILGLGKIMATLFLELERMTHQLPPILKGLGERDIFAAFRKRIDELKTILREKFTALGGEKPAPPPRRPG